MSPQVDALIQRLRRVKQTSATSWMACCPAHEDKSPSLTIRDCDDGRVLFHCHANCSPRDVLLAVGLDFDSVFPPKPLADRVAPLRRPFPAADVLEAVFADALVVQQVANEVQRTGQVTPHQRALLQQAISRVTVARDAING